MNHYYSDSIMKYLIESVNEEIKTFAPDRTKLLFDSLFYHNISTGFDPEDRYYNLNFSLHYYAKALMRIYRFAYYTFDAEVKDSAEYKEFWIKTTKAWFNHFFFIEKVYGR